MTTRANFVATTDIVGGNSGSPMVNAAGDIVGLVFDGNIHSIAGSYWFDPEKNRTIAVTRVHSRGASEGLPGRTSWRASCRSRSSRINGAAVNLR